MKLDEIALVPSNQKEVEDWLLASDLNKAFERRPEGIFYHGNIIVSDTVNTGTLKQVDGTLPFKFYQAERFSVVDSSITTLEALPSRVNGTLRLSNNLYLTSLKDGPKFVHEDFSCTSMPLKDLIGAPRTVFGDVNIQIDSLESLEGIPRVMWGKCYVWTGKELSLVGISEMIDSCAKALTLPWHRIKHGGLGLLQIKNLKELNGNLSMPFVIIEKYLGTDNIIECQSELIEAGYEEYAQL